MKKKIVNAVLVAALVVPSVGTFMSCKDYNEDLSTELKGDLAKEASLRQTLQNQVDALEALVKSINSCKCDLSLYLSKVEAEATYVKKDEYVTQIAALKEADQNLQGLIDAINKTLGDVAGIDDSNRNVAEWISYLNAQIISVKSIAEEALELAKTGKCTCDFTEINRKLSELDRQIAGWNEQLTDVNITATNALTKAESNYLWVIANKKTIDSLATVWNDADLVKRVKTIEDNYMKKDEILTIVGEAKQAAADANKLASDAMSKALDAQTAADNAQKAADNAQTAADNAQKAADNAQTAADNAQTAADNAMNKALQNEVRIGALEDTLKNYVTKKEFKDSLAKVYETINKVSKRVDELDAEIIKIKKDLSNLITGLIVQATDNPVLGYINTPFGINQYMLAAYYGSSDKGIEFPARDGKFYLESSDVNTWTPRDLQVMGISSLKDVEGYFTKQDERFVTEVNGSETGNAGTLYLTVNPSNVNFAGQELALETSAQNPSPIALEPLNACDKELVFGIWRNGTRSVENGFYAAKATLKAEDIDKAKIVIDFESIGKAIKNVIKNGPEDSRTRISVAESAAQVFSAINCDIPAYGLKASWTDEANGDTHNIYSQYNVATTAIKPLSFAFLKDKTWTHVEGFDRTRSVISRVIQEVEVSRPDMAQYEVKFKNIELGDGISVDENGQILATVYYVKDDGSESSPIMIPIEDVYGDLTPTITELVNELKANYGAESEISAKLAEYFNMVQETNNYQTYIDETKASIYSAIDKYWTRIENHILRIMNNAHRSLYITMYGEQNGKFALLSNTVKAPTKAAAGEYNLIPTTYTLQYFAPIYKKFVAVTNVYDAATQEELDLGEAQSLAAAANGGANMFKVVDGLDNCSFKGEKGKIYELTYTAVDYHGVVMIKKFYVEF